MKRFAPASLSAQVLLKFNHQLEGFTACLLTSYIRVQDNRLETYASNAIIAKAGNNIVCYSELCFLYTINVSLLPVKDVEIDLIPSLR